MKGEAIMHTLSSIFLFDPNQLPTGIQQCIFPDLLTECVQVDECLSIVLLLLSHNTLPMISEASFWAFTESGCLCIDIDTLNLSHFCLLPMSEKTMVVC